MEVQAEKNGRRRRSLRTHEERSAETQSKLIEAAIFCLRTYGYSATTTTLVAQQAQLSRGAMLHHFGTKVDLMLAVARYVVAQQNAFFDTELRKVPRGRERFVALTDVTWQALSQPSAIALTEIMMASRSDAELASRFPAVAAELDSIQSEGVWRIAQTAGITDRAAVDAMHRLHRAAMTGLSIMMMFTRKRSDLTPSVELLHSYKEQLADRLIREGAAAGSPASDAAASKPRD